MEERQSGLKAIFIKYHEIIMYCVFGITTTLISWSVYSVCEAWFGLSMRWAGVISWIISVSVAFVTNKLFVFESKSWNPGLVVKEAVTFAGGRLLTGVIEIEAVPRLVSWGFDMTLFGVNGLPAKIVVSVVIVILNYILSKFISFRNRRGKTA